MNHHGLHLGWGWARRVAGMVLLWLGLGALVGVLSAPPDAGLIGCLAGAVAGMVVLAAVGALFGLLGGRWRETLLGAACGLACGIAVALYGGSPWRTPVTGLPVLLGACAGATLPPWCRLQLWLAGQLLAQAQTFRTQLRGGPARLPSRRTAPSARSDRVSCTTSCG